MRKSGLILLLAMAAASWGQSTTPAQPQGTQAQAQKAAPRPLIGNAPTLAEIYCSGYITTDKVPQTHYVAAGWNSFEQTRYGAVADYIYIHGRDMKVGDRFTIVRHVKDPNFYRSYSGQSAAIRDAGDPYFEMGYVRVIDVQKETAVAVPELACSDFVVGDLAIPFVEHQAPVFRVVTLDRFAPPSGKPSGRIIMSTEYDSMLGYMSVVYINLGSDKGIKVGDSLRPPRPYTCSYHDPDASLGRRANANEDTQMHPVKLATGDLSSLPRRTLGDMIVLGVQRK